MKWFTKIKARLSGTFRKREDATIEAVIAEGEKTRKRVDEVEKRLSAEIASFMKGNT